MKTIYGFLFVILASIISGTIIVVVLQTGNIVMMAPVLSPHRGITVVFPKANDVVTSPLQITGEVTGNGWSGFEGQVGQVILLDNNGKILGRGDLAATTDWTILPTQFKTAIEFNVPDTVTGSLVFHNENASGDPTRDKTFTLSVKFK
jgi:hypothetical protein